MKTKATLAKEIFVLCAYVLSECALFAYYTWKQDATAETMLSLIKFAADFLALLTFVLLPLLGDGEHFPQVLGTPFSLGLKAIAIISVLATRGYPMLDYFAHSSPSRSRDA